MSTIVSIDSQLTWGSVAPIDTFVIPMGLAPRVVEHLSDNTKGGFWHIRYVKPLGRAKRAKLTKLTIRTSGYCADELKAAIVAAGGTISE